ncbi:hypothetical protein BGX34_001329 [Mortierella sp. NVP85]|nr:hypothetical protein BGX34_001329 [Mortierella sp. NVP85]
MGKSAKFFKRPTRKEKAVMSLSKETTDTSLFDAVTSEGLKGAAKNKKDTLSTTANRTISKKTSSGAAAAATSAGHPPKASLAYKMQLHGGIKQAVEDLENMDNAELESDDDVDMDTEDAHASDHNDSSRGSGALGKKKEELDKTQPRPDYIELMYGKPQIKNKRKTFMPKPALIK